MERPFVTGVNRGFVRPLSVLTRNLTQLARSPKPSRGFATIFGQDIPSLCEPFDYEPKGILWARINLNDQNQLWQTIDVVMHCSRPDLLISFRSNSITATLMYDVEEKECSY